MKVEYDIVIFKWSTEWKDDKLTGDKDISKLAALHMQTRKREKCFSSLTCGLHLKCRSKKDENLKKKKDKTIKEIENIYYNSFFHPKNTYIKN